MPFQKGISGNPAGRPKRTVEEASLAKFHAHFRNGHFDELLDSLTRLVRKGNPKAIEIVLDYMLGKPTQDMNLSGSLTQIIVRYVDNQDTDDDQPQDAP